MRQLMNKRAQSTAEYAVVIAIVLGAAVGMQTFVKRGLQGRFKDATKTFTESGGTFEGKDMKSLPQYEPYYAHSDISTTVQDDYSDEMKVNDEMHRSGAVSSRTRQGGGVQGESGQDQFDADNGWIP